MSSDSLLEYISFTRHFKSKTTAYYPIARVRDMIYHDQRVSVALYKIQMIKERDIK